MSDATAASLGPRDTQVMMATSKDSEFKLAKVTLPALATNQVEIEIVACGLCHTDCHMHHNDWGVTTYPLVPGHEGVGHITAVGSAVTGFAVGDAVGVGWIRNSCGSCDRCQTGRENLCNKGYQGTYLGASAGIWGKEACNTFGAFSRHIRVTADFAFHLPTGMSMEEAAPLLCAGATLWEPICDYVNSTSRVAVLGLGGLGHMGVKLARAVGADVSVISRSNAKCKAAEEIGATGYLVSGDAAAMAAAAGSFDVILNTGPADLDISPYMGLLAPGGKLIQIGIFNGSVSYGVIPMVFMGVGIVGSIVTGSQRMKQMLRLAQRNNIKCNVEVMPMSKVNDAMAALLQGRNSKFRIVLKW